MTPLKKNSNRHLSFLTTRRRRPLPFPSELLFSSLYNRKWVTLRHYSCGLVLEGGTLIVRNELNNEHCSAKRKDPTIHLIMNRTESQEPREGPIKSCRPLPVVFSHSLRVRSLPSPWTVWTQLGVAYLAQVSRARAISIMHRNARAL